ncbi:MAG: hypothetical protein ACP5T9_03650 [Thermoplasmata archaeon]
MRGSHIPLSTKTIHSILSGKKKALIFKKKKYSKGYKFCIQSIFSNERQDYEFTIIKEVRREELYMYYNDLNIDPDTPYWQEYIKEQTVFYIYYFERVSKKTGGKAVLSPAPTTRPTNTGTEP